VFNVDRRHKILVAKLVADGTTCNIKFAALYASHQNLVDFFYRNWIRFFVKTIGVELVYILVLIHVLIASLVNQLKHIEYACIRF